jgi:WhiB family redox-sensing transcriptional regulator
VAGVTVDNPARVGASPLFLVNLPGAWVEAALCAQTDPDEWFPEKGGLTAPAKAICARCPVTQSCLDYALEHDEPYGVWGGLTRRERLTRQRQEHEREEVAA